MIRTARSADRVKVTFALPLQQTAGRCSVVGDFNEWVPGSHELRKRTKQLEPENEILRRATAYLARDTLPK